MPVALSRGRWSNSYDSHFEHTPRNTLAYIFLRSLIVVSLLFGQELSAYEVSLSPTAIHDAYVLGQRNDYATAEFVAPYVKQISATGADGPRRADIQILTPYSQIVDESRRHATDYNEDQATKNYQRRGNIVTVSVVLIFPAAYPKQHEKTSAVTRPCEVPALQAENFWRNFKFVVKQRGKILALHSARHEPVYSSQTGNEASALDGATVWLDFDASDVASEKTTVEITTPACKLITATFDLKVLR
jgi:hypothetical protein